MRAAKKSRPRKNKKSQEKRRTRKEPAFYPGTVIRIPVLANQIIVEAKAGEFLGRIAIGRV
jgi:hypothetical protein